MATAGPLTLAILRLSLAGMTLLIPRMLLPVLDESARAALITVIYGCAALFALLIFRPGLDETTNTICRWCMTLTILFAVILIADPVTRPPFVFLLRTGVTFLLLGATVLIATRRVSVPIAVTLVALLVLMPVWAAPLVELSGNPAGLTNAVVAISPLTAFAVAIDLDYLRTGWFYANSALGSMRYTYPGWLTLCLLLAVLPVVALLNDLARNAGFPFFRFAKEAQR